MVGSVFYLISLLLSEISTGEEIVRNKISWGFMLMLLWHCEWGKTDLQTGQPWGARWWKMIMKDDDEINALESWSSWHQKLGHKWKCIVCHQFTWLPAVLTAANGELQLENANSSGCSGGSTWEAAKVPILSQWITALEVGCYHWPWATLGPSPGKWNMFILFTPRTPAIWVCLQLSSLFVWCNRQGS